MTAGWTITIRTREQALEMLRCALVRADWYESRHRPVPPLTLETIEILTEAIKR